MSCFRMGGGVWKIYLGCSLGGFFGLWWFLSRWGWESWRSEEEELWRSSGEEEE